MKPRQADAFLPLKPDVFLILIVLIEKQTHGYGLMKEVAERTRERTRLQAGALYRRLRWMLDEGLIEELDRRPVNGDERRRYYRSTAFGRQVAEAEARRMAELVVAAGMSHLLEQGALSG